MSSNYIEAIKKKMVQDSVSKLWPHFESLEHSQILAAKSHSRTIKPESLEASAVFKALG